MRQVTYRMEDVSSKAERGCLQELHKVRKSLYGGRVELVPERKQDWNFVKDRDIYGESKMWNTAKR